MQDALWKSQRASQRRSLRKPVFAYEPGQLDRHKSRYRQKSSEDSNLQRSSAAIK
jgi:hypothetical protein